MIKKHWNMDDMPDQKDKYILITGANDGLGFQLAKSFAQKHAHLIMACRNQQKALEARTAILAQYPGISADIVPLDLGNLQSVTQCAKQVVQNYPKLDIIMINAGIMAVPYGTTDDGLERQMGVNYYGHFALLAQLIPLIRKSEGIRIVTTSSFAGNYSFLKPEKMITRKNYFRWLQYCDSKLAVLMLALMLDDKFRKAGMDASALSAHPGIASSNLRTSQIKTEKNPFQRWFMQFFEIFAIPGEQGVLPLLYVATDPEARGGQYIGLSGFMELRGHPKLTRGQRRAYSRKLQDRLWKVSEEKTGMKIDI